MLSVGYDFFGGMESPSCFRVWEGILGYSRPLCFGGGMGVIERRNKPEVSKPADGLSETRAHRARPLFCTSRTGRIGDWGRH